VGTDSHGTRAIPSLKAARPLASFRLEQQSIRAKVI
jgi:hypothetical protein